jgi:hypothetical protein
MVVLTDTERFPVQIDAGSVEVLPPEDEFSAAWIAFSKRCDEQLHSLAGAL